MQEDDRFAGSARASGVVVESPPTDLNELTSHAFPLVGACFHRASSLRFGSRRLWRGLGKSVGYAP